MRRRTHRYIAWLCVFCMLMTGMPYSVMSDSVPATPTDLQQPAPEETKAPEPETPEAEPSEPGPADPEPSEPGTEKQEPEEKEPAKPEQKPDKPEPEKPAAEKPAKEEKQKEEKPKEPEKPKADRDLKIGEVLTINGKLEKKEYLVRFAPAEKQTMYLILSSDKQLKATVTAEDTGKTVSFVSDGTGEDGRNVLVVADYKAKKKQSYLVRITGPKGAEFTFKMVKKSVLLKEQEEQAPEEPEEEPEEEPAQDPVPEPAEEPVEKPEEKPVEKPAEEPVQEPAEKPKEKPEEKPADVPAEKPTEQPIEKPAETPVEQPEEKPEVQPVEAHEPEPVAETADIPEEKPAEQLPEEPAGQPEEKPAETPEETPATEPVDQPAEAPAGEYTEEQPEEPEKAPAEETQEPAEKPEESAEAPGEVPEVPAEQEAPEEQPDEEPGEEAGETAEAPEENTEAAAEETTEEEPAEDLPEELPDELPVEEPAEEPAEAPEEEPEAEPEEPAMPATPTDLEPVREEPVQEEPVEVRLDAVESGVEAWISFMSDAGIPADAELYARVLPAGADAMLAQALKCDDESCLRYTKYLEFKLISGGEVLNLDTPVTAFVRLPDVEEGAEALQVVCFDGAEPVLLNSEWSDGTLSFRTDALNVFGICNALMPLTARETELATVEVLGFATDAAVSLSRAEDPEVMEGLEVLGTFAVGSDAQPSEGTEGQDGLWIRAGLKEDAELEPMEGVALYKVEDGRADVLVEELTEDAQVVELDAGQVAVVKDTGFRHLTLTVTPDGAEDNQTITLDGLVPKDAEAVAEDVTERFAEHVFPEETAKKSRKALTETTAVSERTTLAAFDISICDENGSYQPDEDRPISVEIVDSRITADRKIELWHIRDDGTEEKVEGITVEEGRIAFEASGFSVYVVVVHEDGTVENPRVEFHFISRDDNALSSGSSVYYASDPWPFTNKDGKTQYTQILKDGESLELITDPGNTEDKHFYGWYVVDPFVVSGTTDAHGIGTSDSKLYYSWPANPEPISFEMPISIQESNISIGDTVHWSLNGVSGEGAVDKDGSVHVFLAPVYDKYNFINFMHYARNTGLHGASNLMTRKLIAMGSAPGIDIKISDIRSTSKDVVHLIFMGWEYNAGTEEQPNWVQIPTVDYTGAEMKDPGRDGVYFTADGLAEGESIDLYPIFVEARWLDFVAGITGSGASFVGSCFLESWGRNGVIPDGMTPKPGVNVFDPSLPVSQRQGYVFEGWYAFAVMDQDTGEITNLTEPKDVVVSYIDDNLEEKTVTINTTALKITNGTGQIVYNGTYRLNVDEDHSYELFEGSGTSLKFYNALDRLKLCANWTPDNSGITVVYWTENADDDGYASSAVKTVTTAELNSQLGTSYASGSEITLAGLQAYLVDSVSILDTKMLDDVQAVPEGEEIFYDLNTERSDQSRTIDGDGNAIFNVYYSRKVFKLVFHIGRDGYVKTRGNQKTAEGWDGNWIEYMFNDNKLRELGYTPHNGTSFAGVFKMTYLPTGRTYTSEYVTNNQNVMGDYVPGADENVYVITAKYGAYIGDRWPTPSNSNFLFEEPPRNTRYTMYTWAGYYGSLYCKIANDRPTWGGQQGNNPDLNGIYSYMSAELCSNREGTDIINQNQVHHIVAYFGEKTNLNRYKQYHTLIEAKEGTYDPENTVLVSGDDYAEYLRTTWSSNVGNVTSEVIIGKTFYEAEGSPTEVISNVNPEFQMAWEFDGYDYFYSCYNVPVQYENHVYFFYTPKQYTLTFMYEDEADRKTDTYYYKQSLADAKKYDDPSKEGYRFLGWYTNEAGAGEPFDFANSTMPAQSLVLYPVFKKLYYVVRIDPNGAEIDHWRTTSTSDAASTGFRVDYKETISPYNFLERNYLPTNDREIQELHLNPDTQVFYYLNTQYISEEHDGKFIPNSLRNALYLTASEIDTYWAHYSSYPESAFTEREAVKFTNKNEWMDAYFGGHNLESLTKYRYKQGAEHYSFMGWYQVMENGSVASVPYNFNTMITEDLEIRALWRLDGGYYIQYNPTYTENGTTVMGDVEQWTDPEDTAKLLYSDQSPTHILRAPSNITEGWVFRGWRVVRYNGTDWVPIQKDKNGEPIYYQPGSDFMIDSTLVSEIADNGAVIHMQAYYEREDSSYRRPDVTSLILDANDPYGGYVNITDSTGLPELDHPGHTWINTEDYLDTSGRPTQILFGDLEEKLQSNLALHLYRYATEQTHGGIRGTNYFSNDDFYLLLGFDENEDPTNPTTGSPYIPAFAADAVAAVTRERQETLYAMWEPMIYVIFVNTTAEPITVQFSGTEGTETVRVVNMVTGEYDREETRGEITIPAKSGQTDGRIKVVLPCAQAGVDVLTAEARNDHVRKKMSVSGTFHDEPCGTGEEDVPYEGTATWYGTLQFDSEGIVVTYTEESTNQVVFDVNTGRWTETSEDYIHLENDLYTINEARIGENGYQPADPTHTGRIFLGWTINADIAAHGDFSSERAVTWGNTTITPDAGGIILDKVREQYLWDFTQSPPYDQTLYAVWSDMVEVVYDMKYDNDTRFHTWNGPATVNTDEPYVFYRSEGNQRYIIWSMAKGERAERPEDPSPHSDNPTWDFITWLELNGSTDSCRNNAKGVAEDVIVNNTFDFTQRVMESVTLVTSWTAYKPQHYTFTVEKRVVGGNANDEFTFNIEVLDELVYGKIASYSSNKIGVPDRRWGSVSTRLKNNQQYTVNVIVSYMDKWSGVYGIEIEVTDRDGNLIKSGQVIYCNKNTYKNFVSDYKYTLKISEEAAYGYDTAVTVNRTDIVGNIDYDILEDGHVFSFTSCKNLTSSVSSSFTPERNTYRVGENNSLKVIFTNTGEPIVAPTAVRIFTQPFAVMMFVGLLLAAGFAAPACIRRRRRGKAALAEETPGKRGDPMR